MRGELGCKVSHLGISKRDTNGMSELRIVDDEGEFLWIVGDNDWEDLIKNAIYDEYQEHNGKVVELCFHTYETFKDDEGNIFYRRGVIKSANKEGIFTVTVLDIDKDVTIHGSWLVDAKTREPIKFTPPKEDLPF